MKPIMQYLSPLCAACLLTAYSFHFSSCANTKAPPSGGPKDTIPPRVVATVPDSNAVYVPRTKTQITLTFNEYVQLKDPGTNIVLSPPQKKRPKTRIRNKSVIVTFPEDLDSARTYSLSFGSSLQDNNEGNILQNYVFSFSTGGTLDSMLVAGTVMDYATLFPLEGVTVAFYAAPSDSVVFNTLPDALARSDKWGYFCVRNLRPAAYAVYAFKDENNNNLYDPGSEAVGFLDSLVIPRTVMRKGMPELMSYDMTDTAACLARPSQLDLLIFKETPSRQFITAYERPGVRNAYIKFNAPNAVIDSFAIRGVRQSKIIKQFNPTFDSLAFWINDSGTLPDTLQLGIKYHKTDSTGALVPAVENLKLVAPRPRPDQDRTDGKAPQARKDLLKFNLIAPPDKVEQDGYVFQFSEPLNRAAFDTIRFTQTTPRKVTTQVPFAVQPDSLDLRRYILRPAEPFKAGNDYEMIIPAGTFSDINGFTNDSTYLKLSLPANDRLSSITLEMKNVNTRYIVELIGEKRDKVYRKYIITGDGPLLFPYLDKGSYSIRITEDKNNNGLLDAGSVLEKRQPEKVRLYHLEDGNTVIQLPERTDLVQTIDVQHFFH